MTLLVRRSRSLRRCFALGLVLALVMLAAQATVVPAHVPRASASTAPLVGAIRWDGWHTGETQAKTLVSDDVFQKYGYREPVYGWYDAGTGVPQSTMDSEILDASSHHIDYWAFDWFPDHVTPDNSSADVFLDGEGSSPGSLEYAQSFEAYENSPYKADLQYTFILLSYWVWHGYGGPSNPCPDPTQPGCYWRSDWVPQLINNFKSPQWVHLSGNRPLLYIFDETELSPSATATEIQYLKDQTTGVLDDNGVPLGTPVIIDLGERSDSTLESMNIDGSGSYGVSGSTPTEPANAPDSNTSSNQTTQWCYQAQADQDQANLSLHSGVLTEPSVTAVDDPRPRMDDPNYTFFTGYAGWVQQPTRTEFEAAFKNMYDAAKASSNTTDPPTVLIYSWNELDEGGGGIIPTVQNGYTYLDAINDVVTQEENGASPTPYVDEYNGNDCALTHHGPGGVGSGSWSQVFPVVQNSFSSPGTPPTDASEPFENDDEVSSTVGDGLYLTAANSTGFQVMATKGPDRRYLDVYLGSTLVASVNLYSPTYEYRQAVYTYTTSVGTHEIGLGVSASVDPNATAYASAHGIPTITGIDSVQVFVSPPGAVTPTSLVTSTSLNGELRNDFDGSVGFAFTTPPGGMTVTDLGRYYFPGDATHPANSGYHYLALLDASTLNRLANVIVQMRPGEQDQLGFEYAHLPSPVQLAGSHTYYLLSGESSGGDYWYGNTNLPSFTVSTGSIDNGESYDNASGTLSSYPSVNYGSVGFGPVNLLYS